MQLRQARATRGAHRRTAQRVTQALARIAMASALVGLSTTAPRAIAADPEFRGPYEPFGLTTVDEYARLGFADLDGDGDLDGFVGQFDGTRLFENTGTTTSPAFAPATLNPFGLDAGGAPPAGGIALGDFDGDGDLDILDGSRFFENTGTTTGPAFAPPVTSPFGSTGFDPAPVDLDADGDLDLLEGDLFIENTGTPTSPAFGPSVFASSFGLVAEGSGSASFGDLDGDGDFDALVTSAGEILFARNIGTPASPSFVAPTAEFGFPDMKFQESSALADLDGDGDLDALVLGANRSRIGGDSTTHIAWFENTGAATAPAFRALVNPFGIGGTQEYNAAGFGDIDGDGDLDVFVGAYNDLYFHENTGSASFPAFAARTEGPFGIDSSLNHYVRPQLVDIDGDGDLDLLASGETDAPVFAENTGNASNPAFAPDTWPVFGLTSYVSGYYGTGSFAFTDFVDIDGDGDFDAVMGRADYGYILFQENTGDASNPAFAPGILNPFGLQPAIEYASPTFVDIDGDGDFDAIVGNSYGDVFFARNTGTTTGPAFAPPTMNPFGFTDSGADVAPTFADIDADGLPDAFLGERLGNLAFFENYTPPPPTRTLDLEKASARVAGANGLVRAKGTFVAGRIDTSAGLTFRMTDGGTLDESVVIPSGLCETKKNGTVKCRTLSPGTKQKTIAVFKPVKKSDQYKFKFLRNKLTLSAPLVGPMTLRIDENTTGDPPLEGQATDCVATPTKILCKD